MTLSGPTWNAMHFERTRTPLNVSGLSADMTAEKALLIFKLVIHWNVWLVAPFRNNVNNFGYHLGVRSTKWLPKYVEDVFTCSWSDKWYLLNGSCLLVSNHKWWMTNWIWCLQKRFWYIYYMSDWPTDSYMVVLVTINGYASWNSKSQPCPWPRLTIRGTSEQTNCGLIAQVTDEVSMCRFIEQLFSIQPLLWVFLGLRNIIFESSPNAHSRSLSGIKT